MKGKSQCVLFDWGDTLMRVFPQFQGPMAEWPRVEAMPYARQTLEQLHPDYTLALATNAADSGENQIRRALIRADLAEWIDIIFCTRGIGYRKPEEAYFKAIMKKLGLPAKRIIMVGDDFHADILGANKTGIKSVWYNWRTPFNKQNKMYCTIHDLRDLRVALDNLICPSDS